MTETRDSSGVTIRPPLALLLAFAAGLLLNWLYPLPWLPANFPHHWIGAAIFMLGLALAAWAIVIFSGAGTHVPTSQPTTTIVADGPYRFSRNPIYLGMFLGLIGFAVGFDSLWFFAALVPFYFALRYGVVAREEAYLERKFGGVYLDYKSRVRRWL